MGTRTIESESEGGKVRGGCQSERGGVCLRETVFLSSVFATCSHGALRGEKHSFMNSRTRRDVKSGRGESRPFPFRPALFSGMRGVSEKAVGGVLSILAQ